MDPPRLNHCNKLGVLLLEIMNVTTCGCVHLADDAIHSKKRTYCRFGAQKDLESKAGDIYDDHRL
jgi:hypothetical protein